MKRMLFLLSLVCAAAMLRAQDDALLFYQSCDRDLVADYAAGNPVPNFYKNIDLIGDGALGSAFHCRYRQLLSYWAPGNIYAQRGTLSFWWRAGDEPYTETEFPIFRVGFADHTSWDMTWLRIDYNGHGFDAFVTDNNLVRVRVSTTVDPMPKEMAWSHFAFSWDENTGIRLYLNGREIARRDTCVVLDCGLDQFGPHSRIISPYQVQSMYNMQRGGDLDELRIYSRMLEPKEVAALSRKEEPSLPRGERDLASDATRSEWLHRYGFDGPAPEALKDAATTVRKVQISEVYDELRRYWKSNDGIRETTWPGVYNRSSIEGRNDYFQLPDWDCYSTSGKAVRWILPDEPWNQIEIYGGAFGTLTADGARIADKPRGTQKSVWRVDRTRRGGTLEFTNEVQETPIGEFDALYVHAGDAPAGKLRLSYTLGGFRSFNDPALSEVEEYVRGRFQPEERTMMLALNRNPLPVGVAKKDKQPTLPIVHIVIPSGTKDLAMYETPQFDSDAANLAQQSGMSTWGTTSYSWDHIHAGLDGIRVTLPALPLHGDAPVAMNIQIKDPLWPLRNMLDFTFSVRPGEERILWLDLRDRILPDGKPLYLTLASAAPEFDAVMLEGAKIDLVFKDYEAAKPEHITDRILQVRDLYGVLVEEGTKIQRLNLWNRIHGDMTDLLRVDPDNEIGRQYWYKFFPEQGAPEVKLPEVTPGMPEWAFWQLQVLHENRDLLEWYIDHRQMPYGEFGGGISDDTEFANFFAGMIHMGVMVDKSKESFLRFLGAIDRNGTLTKGMSTIMTDGLHTYEEGVETVCGTNIAMPGDPQLFDRLLESAKSVQDHILGVNKAGHLHFRSDYFSATKIADKGVWTRSEAREILHLGPAMLLGEFFGNPTARDLVTRYVDGVVAHATYNNGRMAIPTEIDFVTDEAFEYTSSLSHPYMMFNYAWHWTAKPKFMEMMQSAGGPRPIGYASREAARDAFVEAYKTVKLNDYIMREGSTYIDHVIVYSSDVQKARLGQVCMYRGADYMPLNLLSWRFADQADAEQVAILVTNATETAFDVVLYNTTDHPVKLDMIGFRVLSGTWRCNGRNVAWGNDRAIPLEIPAGQEYTVSMALKGKGKDAAGRPDLAIGAPDVVVGPTAVTVTLHNLAGVTSPTMDVVLKDASGAIVARTRAPRIPAPTDFIPKTATITFPLTGQTDVRGWQVVIDPNNKVDELYESNNVVVL